MYDSGSLTSFLLIEIIKVDLNSNFIQLNEIQTNEILSCMCVWSLNELVGVFLELAPTMRATIRADFFFWNDDMRFLYLHPHYVTNKLKEFIIHALLLARIEHVNI